MSYSHVNDNMKHGFTCSYGRFLAHPGAVERVDGSALRSMFLPKLTPEGQRKLNEGHSGNFVRGQLKHYGVPFDGGEISGNGTLLLKKVLQAGKCDKVPDHISELCKQMHTEWLNGLTPKELSGHPELVIERYFLSSGELDLTKTTAVVGIPFDQHSSYRSGQMREAASKITGLHQATGMGSKTQTIFMGWNSAAVEKAAKSHVAKEAEVAEAEEEEREQEREEQHQDYLNTLKRKKALRTYSPVGSYIIDCKEIEQQWPDQGDDLCLNIHPTREPTIFEASFDFGVLEGVMVISTEKDDLEKYCSQLDLEADSGRGEDDEGDWSEEEDEDNEEGDDEDKLEDNGKNTTGSKRKAKAPLGHGSQPKKSKAEAALPRTYQLKLKCRETGEGVIHSAAESGTIKFKNEKLASFVGNADLPVVGKGVPFTARKISDVPDHTTNSWADYSESAYEYERVRRWR